MEEMTMLRILPLVLATISGTMIAASATAQDVALPPSDETAEQALAASPRHHEIVQLDVPSSGTKINAHLIFPERAERAPVVIVIHEIFGMTEWIQSVADHLASQGFIAIAPDMIADKQGDMNNMGKVRALTADEIIERTTIARDHALSLPAANGNYATMGFCWGGSASFLYATADPELDAAVVFYGSAPDTALLKNVRAPILAHYGEMDARVNTTRPAAQAELERLGKTFEWGEYTNAGHGFLRAQAGRGGSNLGATEQAWPRTIAFLRGNMETAR
jgi:carboxymethylenebutenolidase